MFALESMEVLQKRVGSLSEIPKIAGFKSLLAEKEWNRESPYIRKFNQDKI